MDLKVKYSKLISLAQESKVADLSVTEQNNVLHISGVTSPEIKDRIWEVYNEIDPDMRSGDLVLNLQVVGPGQAGANIGKTYEVKAGDNLSKIAKEYPNMTWQKIFDANRDILQDPNKVYPGQKLKIPVE